MKNNNTKVNKSLNEVLNLINNRDKRDFEIDKVNREKLIAKGFVLAEAKRKVEIDTGKIVGIENVVNRIKKDLIEDDKIIALEGLCGVGKSTTSKALKKELGAKVFSFGEVFRYLAYCHFVKSENDYGAITKNLHYKIEHNDLKLYLNEINITDSLEKHLTRPEFVVRVPEVAEKTQHVVVSFFQKEIKKLRSMSEERIILEGRAFTLDFLPCDVRFELVADSTIRAKRRLDQDED